jgi:hypothetical protein
MRKYILTKTNIIDRQKDLGGLGIEVLGLKNAYSTNGCLNY